MSIYKVYVIVNKINGKMYVGCTERPLEIRLAKHFSKTIEGSQNSLSKAIRKYGKKNFEIRMIEEYSSRETMFQGECDWIAYFDTYKSRYGYNDTPGGEGGNTNGGKKFSDDWRMNISVSLTGKSLSEWHCSRLSESHKGNVASNRKITFQIAEQIRADYSTGNFTQKQLGVKYGLSQDCIFKIIKKRTYIK